MCKFAYRYTYTQKRESRSKYQDLSACCPLEIAKNMQHIHAYTRTHAYTHRRMHPELGRPYMDTHAPHVNEAGTVYIYTQTHTYTPKSIHLHEAGAVPCP